MSAEKRTSRRQDLSWPGQVVDLDGQLLCGCKFMNVSETGAKLIVPDDAVVPDEFVLHLAGDGAVQRRCKVMWHTDEGIGVQFLRSPQADDREKRTRA